MGILGFSMSNVASLRGLVKLVLRWTSLGDGTTVEREALPIDHSSTLMVNPGSQLGGVATLDSKGVVEADVEHGEAPLSPVV